MFLTDVLQNRNFQALSKYINFDTYVDHNQEVEGGLDAYFESRKENYSYDFTFKVIGQGNFVVSFSKVVEGDDDIAVFDVFRLSNGLIVEHWDNKEKISPRSEWNNSGKF